MIAAGIMAMAFVYLAGSIISVASTNSISEGQTLAHAHASSVLEDIKNTPFANWTSYAPPVMTGLGAGEQIQVHVATANGAWVALPTANLAAPNPAQVRVTINWTDRKGRPLQVRASTLVAR